MKDDAVVRIQSCIAQASKYQLEDSVRLLQLEILALMLDLACSLYQKSPQIVSQKVRLLQTRLDHCLNSDEWGLTGTELSLPIHKQSGNLRVISGDTASVLRPGEEHEQYDYLVLSFWSKLEAFTVTYENPLIPQLSFFANRTLDIRILVLGSCINTLEMIRECSSYGVKPFPNCRRVSCAHVTINT